MFEGKPPHTADALPLEERSEGESLRQLNWSDLVARLSAARELRASFGAYGAGDQGSFDASSARCIAAQHNGDHGVNPEDSSYGKGAQGMAPAVHDAVGGVARN